MDTESRALAARTDEQALGELIESDKAWILARAGETAHKYITESDDEWSIALMAFNEAVQGYDRDKGSFHGFASVVIKRRLLDYIRSQWRYKNEIQVGPDAFDEPEGEDGEGPDPAALEVRRKLAEEQPRDPKDAAAEAREEIAAAQELLKPYGFSFYDLAESSPKAEKTKRACAMAVKALLKDTALLSRMKSAKALPMKELEAESGVARKILDRHRRYIIAAAEILSGDYPVLAEYLGYIRKILKE
ncbi:MAG: RNA polymerase subunit sigma [Firmicutes bacterium]|nr:RNA polymerase subunit sigma [Bacillota bacterium]